MNCLLATRTSDLAVHRQAFGDLPWQGPGRLVDAVEAAGRSGRGPAIPAIGKGAEGEPASAKDRTLLAKVPHLVLDGLQLVAEAVGAAHVALYLPAASVPSLGALLAQRRDRRPVRLVPVKPSFVAGQETAAASAVAGGRPIPRDGLVRLVDRG